MLFNVNDRCGLNFWPELKLYADYDKESLQRLDKSLIMETF